MRSDLLRPRSHESQRLNFHVCAFEPSTASNERRLDDTDGLDGTSPQRSLANLGWKGGFIIPMSSKRARLGAWTHFRRLYGLHENSPRQGNCRDWITMPALLSFQRSSGRKEVGKQDEPDLAFASAFRDFDVRDLVQQSRGAFAVCQCL